MCTHKVKMNTICLVILICLVFLVSCQESEKNMDANLPSPGVNEESEAKSSMNDFTEEFLEKYADYFSDKWTPDKILDYKEDGMIDISQSEPMILGYIQKLDKDMIVVDEIEWVLDNNEPNGFRIENDTDEAVEYQLAKSCEIWILADSAIAFRVPISDFKAYMNVYGDDYSIWNISLKDGKIDTIYQQYLP